MSLVLEAIQFNHDPTDARRDALNLRRNFQQPVAVPEWQRGRSVTANDSVAAYALQDVLGHPVTIRARFQRLVPQLAAAQVRAVQPRLPWEAWAATWPTVSPYWWQYLLQAKANVLGEVAPQTVVFRPSGESDFVTFTLQQTRLASCGVGVHEVVWHWQYRLGIADPWIDFAVTRHLIYTLVRAPGLPWTPAPGTPDNTQLVWTDVLDFACRWAWGARSPDEAAGAITRAIYQLGQGLLSYDCTLGATAYAFEWLLLSEFLELLRGGIGRGRFVNCSDCAAIVSTFANALGADLWQSRMGGLFAGPLQYFPVNPIRTIGSAWWGLPCGVWPGWTFHEVAWKNGCTAADEVFDACLQLDQYPPYRFGLLPVNLPFGRIGDGLYRDLLATPEGRQLCEPDPTMRRRRPVL